MDRVRIKLRSGDGGAEILRSLEHISQRKILFECPRNFALVSDMAFLKKLKAEALKKEKRLVFTAPQDVLYDMLQSQKMEVYKTVTKEFQDQEPLSLSDIFPRVEAQKTQEINEKTQESVQQKKSSRPFFSTRRIEAITTERSVRGKIFFGFLGIIAFLGFVFVWISPHATITIKPKVSPLTEIHNFLVALPEADIPNDEASLPVVQAIMVQTEIRGEETFISTGRTYDITNAKGKITLLNETSRNKYLVPSRLLTRDGVIFRFKEAVTIPPRLGEEIGRLTVEVEADPYDEDGRPIGERGNITAGTELFFPALRNESRELYYARANKGPLVGGSSLAHYFVTEEDRAISQRGVEETFRVRGIEALEEEIARRSNREGVRYVLINNPQLLTSELLEFHFPEDLVGTERQTFQVQGVMKVKGVVFDQSEILNVLEEKLLESQDERKKLLHIDPHSVTYQVMEGEHLEDEQWVKLSISAIGVEVLDVDPDSAFGKDWFNTLRKQIAGKPIRDIRAILANDPEIDDVLDMDVSPFWADTMPDLWDQIEFELEEIEGARGR